MGKDQVIHAHTNFARTGRGRESTIMKAKPNQHSNNAPLNHNQKTRYEYPTTETLTDATEIRQDANKLHRERHVISAAMSFEWRVGIDFGCGAGRHITTLLDSSDAPKEKKIIAYDVDEDRVHTAQSKFTNRNSVTFISGRIDSLIKQTKKNSLDAALCCQVLGHVSPAEFDEIFSFFSFAMTLSGMIVACVPFIASPLNADFYHSIDTSKQGSTAPIRRQRISVRKFSRMAQNPKPGILPVRAFGIPQLPPQACNSWLPIACGIPRPFDEINGWKAVSSSVYSIHDRISGERADAVGDIIIKMRREE